MPENTQQSKTLRLERTFNATPQRLWAAWTDPKIYAKWLNPSGIDLVIHEWDARPGGKVRFDMPQPDGNQNPQSGVFLEMEPYTRLVTGEPDRSFAIEVTFEPRGAKTHMVVNVTGIPPEWRQPAIEGWGKSLDQLERVLAKGGSR